MLFSNAPEKQIVVKLPQSAEIHFSYMPAGEFLMGSPETEMGRDRDESPQIRHTVASFYLGTYEVTQRQWLAVMGYNPATFQQSVDHLDYPIESVSWHECQAFVEKLNTLGIGSFRMPTEIEWEYAARAGTTTPHYWGEQQEDWFVNKKAWINSRSLGMTHPVGTKEPNPWGLYDIAGNVWEWTSTSYGPYGEAPSDHSQKVFRGGSWYDFGKSQRSANRHRHGIDEKYPVIGLRLVWKNE